MKLTRQLIALLVFSLLSSQVLALKSDRDQPADIEADSIEFDLQKGTRTYIDNVLAVQGTLRLKADKLFAEYDGSDLKKATIYGSLARFKQRPDGKEHDVEGWAKKIIVDQKANTLTLIGKAALKQGPNTARGETIVYNMANDTLRVQGKAKVGAAGKDGTAPKRKIEDPFKDNADGPPEPKKKKKKKKKKVVASAEGAEEDAVASEESDEADEAEATDEAEDAEEVEAKPTRSGRSRLIIEPN